MTIICCSISNSCGSSKSSISNRVKLVAVVVVLVVVELAVAIIKELVNVVVNTIFDQKESFVFIHAFENSHSYSYS